MKLLEDKIIQLLNEHLYINEKHVFKKHDFDFVCKRYKTDIENVLEDLEGQFPENMSIPNLPIANNHFLLKILSGTEFNRYRLKTLRADFYENITWFKLNEFRTNCRNQESECLKTAGNKTAWTNPQDEKYFGKSEAPGDFGLNGSASWKKQAFQSFLQDLLLFHEKKPVITISVYDKLMVNGSLITVEKLLSNSPQQFDQYFWQFLNRKINNNLIIP